jgi:hypothetical protein
MLNARSHGLGALQTLVSFTSWLDQEKLAWEIGNERKRGFPWVNLSAEINYT